MCVCVCATCFALVRNDRHALIHFCESTDQIILMRCIHCLVASLQKQLVARASWLSEQRMLHCSRMLSSSDASGELTRADPPQPATGLPQYQRGSDPISVSSEDHQGPWHSDFLPGLKLWYYGTPQVIIILPIIYIHI